MISKDFKNNTVFLMFEIINILGNFTRSFALYNIKVVIAIAVLLML